jgi:hypothetical protein
VHGLKHGRSLVHELRMAKLDAKDGRGIAGVRAGHVMTQVQTRWLRNSIISFAGARRDNSSMPEEHEEPEAEGEEVEGEGEDGEPKPPSLPIPGAEDQFEQLNEMLRNNQVCGA